MYPEVAAPVVFDVYPATVLSPDGAVVDSTKCRAIGTPSWLVVYGERRLPETARPVARTVAKIPLVASRPHPRSAGAWIITDDQGQEWTVTRGSGCGCNSPLRHLLSPVPLDL